MVRVIVVADFAVIAMDGAPGGDPLEVVVPIAFGEYAEGPALLIALTWK